MAITLQQIRKILKEPTPNRKIVPKAKAHQNRCAMHVSSDASYTGHGNTMAHSEYLNWVSSFMIPDKFKTFLKLFRAPVDTIPLTEESLSQLKRVFNGRDRNIRFEFTNPDLNIEWEEFTKSQALFWQNQSFETMARAINSVMIIDLPIEQITDNPEPYISFHDISTVQDFELIDESRFDWLMVKQSDDILLVYDDEHYRVLKWDGGEVLTVVTENPHDLGYCPASFFWTDPISYSEPAVKKSPLTNWLAKLDWFLLWSICKKHSDLYAPFPIYEVVKESCNYKGDDDSFCVNGYLQGADRQPVLLASGLKKPCPSCSVDNLAGPGSKIVTQRVDFESDLPQSVRTNWPDVGSLKHVLEQENLLKKEIFSGITGNSISLIEDQAINEKQVRSLFEDRLQVLLNVKVNFERAQLFAEETQARLRYGDRFVGGHVSYGSEFYLFSADDLFNMYTEAREKKLDHILLDDVYAQYVDTRYKDNPTQLHRQNILVNLDPFRHLTDEQVDGLYKDNAIDAIRYMLKKNFSALIKRFERENIDIVKFGTGIDFKTKIQRILAALISYIDLPQGEAGNLESTMTLYGIGVRSGAITPQREDEDHFRQSMSIPGVSSEGQRAWQEDGGIRRPVTLKSKTELDDELN